MGVVKRGEVYWLDLDPAFGSEIKTRPAFIVSPDDLNAALPKVFIAPLTSKGQPLGCRPEIEHVSFFKLSASIFVYFVYTVFFFIIKKEV